jgi:hypothetical protein
MVINDINNVNNGFKNLCFIVVIIVVAAAKLRISAQIGKAATEKNHPLHSGRFHMARHEGKDGTPCSPRWHAVLANVARHDFNICLLHRKSTYFFIIFMSAEIANKFAFPLAYSYLCSG